MPKGTTSSNDSLKLVYTAVAIGNIADNPASSPLTNIYASLHSAWPGVGGDQTTNEISYTGYARVAVARSGSGWTLKGRRKRNFTRCRTGRAAPANPRKPSLHTWSEEGTAGPGSRNHDPCISRSRAG